ncbi:NAD(P)H-dependent oxidoreductase [Pasteurella bettyae]|uniref:Flavin reductase n=1 Tax=Pasteurella bettyae CCUG 2042 TaxID=1095749 RepID=I3DAM6_9PAST|nr:NAD(P)H-dependent oxidoreductase [Pasteurella bettyae]EIJ68769.1 flavin reductase [Pasteurella bettyae CCUG 2042]SUB20872.1 NAD(P)H oxidoreductase [Pasteurella bettyae]
MKHLVIFAHPNTKNSFNKAILERVLQASKKANVETVVRDLYSMEFNPVISWEELSGTFQGIIASEIKYEQKLISEADLITLVYPLWWMGYPAILKGYLERVLTAGFAYQSNENGTVGLLTGKQMQQFITLGNGVERYQKIGFAKSLDDTLVNGLFNYVGINDIEHSFLGDIHIIDAQARHKMLDEVEAKIFEKLTALLGAKVNV